MTDHSKTPGIGLSDEEVAAIRRWASSEPTITEVRLYGSRLLGTHRPDSDVDLAVSFTFDEEGEQIAHHIDNRKIWETKIGRAIRKRIHIDSLQLARVDLRSRQDAGMILFSRA